MIIPNDLPDRKAFAALITPELTALEIGPFCSPMLKGPNVSYCDVLTQEELIKRAESFNLSPSLVQPVDYTIQKLDDIPKKFDAILSSHVVEHQPDLVRHLQQVARRLNADGHYLVLIPNLRYCFDRYIASSTIADVMQAYLADAPTSHSLKSLIAYHALTVHNDAKRHWHENYISHTIEVSKIKEAIGEWYGAQGKYIDVHGWYFTPQTFAEIIDLLHQLGCIDLTIEQVYDTKFETNEFWAVLKK